MRKMLICLVCMADACLFGQGIPYGQEFQVNSSMCGYWSCPCIAALTEGGFVVCWDSLSASVIYGQVFDDSGERRNGEFQVVTSPSGNQQNPSVAGLPGGGFVVCWNSINEGIVW
jgi:large repetitive protein